jgi:probable phosphoglycerate mutase
MAGRTALFCSLVMARPNGTDSGGSIGARVEVVDDLAEMHHGEFAGRTSEDLSGEAVWAEREYDRFTWRFPGGESYADLDRRARCGLEHIEESECERRAIGLRPHRCAPPPRRS